MGNVIAFSNPSRANAQSVNDNVVEETKGQVIELVVNKKIAHGIPARPLYLEIEAILRRSGVDFSCHRIKSDFKMISYLIQGMIDRGEGCDSSKTQFLECMKLMDFHEPSVEETNELFGDLLGKLD
jgi:hypothetical protein